MQACLLPLRFCSTAMHLPTHPCHPQRRFTFGKYVKGTQYNFQVQAHNKAGWSALSAAKALVAPASGV